MFKIFSFSNATLFVALVLSSIAAWYSIIGLTAIFSGAVVPIIIMGSALELGKVVTTVWLRKYWRRCSWILKLYLVPAVVLLAFLTSMGIFGFLSKAHTEQNVIAGDSLTKLTIIDEKIKTQRDNIELAKKALVQMDAQVDNVMNKGDSEKSAERSVQIRRQQAKERAQLQKEIANSQKEVQKLNEERAPIAAENRKVEAEVGPIKYIAALIYGDNPDQNLLERAVRWVIIILVIVFDPLALMLVIGANQSREWDNEEREKEIDDHAPPLYVADVGEKPTQEELDEINEKLSENNNPPGWMFNDPGEHPKDDFQYETTEKVEKDETIFDKHPYLLKPFIHFKNLKPMVYKPETEIKDEVAQEEQPIEEVEPPTNPEQKILAFGVDVIDSPGDYLTNNNKDKKRNPIVSGDYVEYDNKYMHKDVFATQYPELFLKEDSLRSVSTSFGTQFPNRANTGDTFVRVDIFPNRVYKYNGVRWLESNRNISETYLSSEYIEFLISKIATGEYDPEMLTQNEQEAITAHINKKNG